MMSLTGVFAPNAFAFSHVAFCTQYTPNDICMSRTGQSAIYRASGVQCMDNVQNICAEEFEGRMLSSGGGYGQCIARETYNCEIDSQRAILDTGLIAVPIIIVVIVLAIIINKIKNRKKHCRTCGTSINPKSKFCGKCGVSC